MKIIQLYISIVINIQMQEETNRNNGNNLGEESNVKSKVRQHEVKVNPGSKIKVVDKFCISTNEQKIYSIKFDKDDKYIAAGKQSGVIEIYNVKKQSLSYTINNEGKAPFSYLLWRPENSHYQTRNILTTANSDGEIQNWHLTSGKCLSTMKQTSNIIDKQLYCIDYNLQGTKLVSCGSQPVIRVYDEVKRKKQIQLSQPNFPYNSHTNRVYCVKFNRDPQFQHIIYSAGWDTTVVVWDLRVGKPVQNIYGPYICGDGIANEGMDLLTASWRPNDQLQQWESRKCELNQTLDWDGLRVSNTPCFLYTCQFSKKHKDLIVAGGSNSNEVKLFDTSNNNKPFCVIYNLPAEIGTVDFSHDDSKLAISGADGCLRVFSISEG